MILPCKRFLATLFFFGLVLSCYSTVTHTGNPTVAGCQDNFTTNTAGTNYAWDFGPNSYPRYATGSASAITSFLTAGSHDINVVISTGGGPVTETLNITVQASPGTATLIANKPLCITSSVTFTASATGAIGYAFFVNDSARQVGFGATFTYTIQFGDSIRAFALIGTCYVPSPTLHDATPEPPLLTSTMVHDTICAGDLVTFTPIPAAYDSFIYYVGGSLQRASSISTWSTTTIGDSNQIHVDVFKNGCRNYFWSNIVTAHVKPTPQMSLSASATSICQGAPVTFTASVQQTATDSFNFWVNSARAQSGNSTANTYTTATLNNQDTVIVTGSLKGCQSKPSTAIIITVNTTPPVTLTSSDANDSICQGESITFTANPSSYNNYEFFNGGISLQSGASATYTTTALTNGNTIYAIASSAGCPPQHTDTMSIVVTPAPVVDAGPATLSACIYAPQDTLAGFSPPGGNWTGTGITDATNGFFDPATAGAGAHTLTYTYTDPTTTCSASGNVTITVNARPTVAITPVNPAICEGQQIQITASGASTYRWNADPTLSDITIAGPVASPTATTTYTVTGTDNNNCSNTATADVSVSAASAVDFTPQPGCSGQVSIFELTTNPPPPNTTFTWYFGDGSVSNSPNATHTYTSGNTYNVILITQQGICADTITKPVVVQPGADASFDANPVISYVGDSVQFINHSAGADTYLWDLGDQTTSDVQSFSHAYKEAGVYTVTLTVSNLAGCADSLTKKNYIIIYRKPKLFIPNAFTPNNQDGNNDVLHVFGDALKDMDFVIYNRIGEKVYESNNISSELGEGWDGTYKGALAPAGVYSYTMRVVFEDNSTRDYKGSISLLR